MSAIWIEKEDDFTEVEFELIVLPPEIVFSFSTADKEARE